MSVNSGWTINHDFLFKTCHELYFIYDSLVVQFSVSTVIERSRVGTLQRDKDTEQNQTYKAKCQLSISCA